MTTSVPPDTRPLYRSAAGHAALVAWYTAALARIDTPLESLWLPTRFGATHLLAAGPPQAPPVLLLTTWGGSAPLWAPQIPALASAMRVYAVDIPGGSGRSAPTLLSPNNADYGEWLADLLDGLGLAQAALVGVSYGSWMAARAAGLAPQRVSRLALLSLPFLAPVSLSILGEVAGITLNPFLSLEAKLRRFALAVLAPSGLQATPELQAVADWFVLLVTHARHISPTPPPPRGLLFQPPAAELGQVRAPTLVLLGEHEPMYDARQAAAAAPALLPGLIAAEVLPRAGHALMYNRAELVNRRLLAFLGAA